MLFIYTQYHRAFRLTKCGKCESEVISIFFLAMFGELLLGWLYRYYHCLFFMVTVEIIFGDGLCMAIKWRITVTLRLTRVNIVTKIQRLRFKVCIFFLFQKVFEHKRFWRFNKISTNNCLVNSFNKIVCDTSDKNFNFIANCTKIILTHRRY